MAHTILISFDPAHPGQMATTVSGIPGPACTDVTKWLNSLGEVITDLHTGEYYEEAELEDVESVQAGTDVSA